MSIKGDCQPTTVNYKIVANRNIQTLQNYFTERKLYKMPYQ